MSRNRDALIGHTGFVGGNLDRQIEFGARFNSSNIEDMAGGEYASIYCAGAPGQKWRANQEPEADRASIEALTAALADVRCEHFVLISTIDVYPDPTGVDEATPIEEDAGSPYGRHRLWLETFITDCFEATVVRLPGLFGPGLKKNVIFDVLNDNMVDRIQPRSTFQFYDLGSIAEHVALAREARLPLVNLATEPVRVDRLLRDVFGVTLDNPEAPPPARYDFRTRYAETFGGKGGYIQTVDQVLDRCRAFVKSEGWGS